MTNDERKTIIERLLKRAADGIDAALEWIDKELDRMDKETKS